jgi:hypothetical protein
MSVLPPPQHTIDQIFPVIIRDKNQGCLQLRKPQGASAIVKELYDLLYTTEDGGPVLSLGDEDFVSLSLTLPAPITKFFNSLKDSPKSTDASKSTRGNLRRLPVGID